MLGYRHTMVEGGAVGVPADRQHCLGRVPVLPSDYERVAQQQAPLVAFNLSLWNKTKNVPQTQVEADSVAYAKRCQDCDKKVEHERLVCMHVAYGRVERPFGSQTRRHQWSEQDLG